MESYKAAIIPRKNNSSIFELEITLNEYIVDFSELSLRIDSVVLDICEKLDSIGDILSFSKIYLIEWMNSVNRLSLPQNIVLFFHNVLVFRNQIPESVLELCIQCCLILLYKDLDDSMMCLVCDICDIAKDYSDSVFCLSLTILENVSIESRELACVIFSIVGNEIITKLSVIEDNPMIISAMKYIKTVFYYSQQKKDPLHNIVDGYMYNDVLNVAMHYIMNECIDVVCQSIEIMIYLSNNPKLCEIMMQNEIGFHIMRILNQHNDKVASYAYDLVYKLSLYSEIKRQQSPFITSEFFENMLIDLKNTNSSIIKSILRIIYSFIPSYFCILENAGIINHMFSCFDEYSFIYMNDFFKCISLSIREINENVLPEYFNKDFFDKVSVIYQMDNIFLIETFSQVMIELLCSVDDHSMVINTFFESESLHGLENYIGNHDGGTLQYSDKLKRMLDEANQGNNSI